MKTHYAKKRSFLKDNNIALCGKQEKMDIVSDDYKECDCRWCISAMEADQKHWHDEQIEQLIYCAGALK